MAEGNFNEARLYLEDLQQVTEKTGRTGDLIEVRLLLALTLKVTGDDTGAIRLLTRVISLAEQEGYFRIFIDMGITMTSLLKETIRQYQPSDFIRRLLSECETKPFRSTIGAVFLSEPLTSRELEILKLLADDLSNQEIARKLILSIGTVETHANHIYAKLGVTNRAQAIKRATNLNLL